MYYDVRLNTADVLSLEWLRLPILHLEVLWSWSKDGIEWRKHPLPSKSSGVDGMAWGLLESHV